MLYRLILYSSYDFRAIRSRPCSWLSSISPIAVYSDSTFSSRAKICSLNIDYLRTLAALSSDWLLRFSYSRTSNYFTLLLLEPLCSSLAIFLRRSRFSALRLVS